MVLRLLLLANLPMCLLRDATKCLTSNQMDHAKPPLARAVTPVSMTNLMSAPQE